MEVKRKWYYFSCIKIYKWMTFGISINYNGWNFITPLFGINYGRNYFARISNGIQIGFWPNRKNSSYLYSFIIKFYPVNSEEKMRPWNRYEVRNGS